VVALSAMSISAHDAVMFELAARSEVHQESRPISGSGQVIVGLCAVVVDQLGDGLDLHDNPIEAGEIRLVGLFENPIFESENERGLAPKWNPGQGDRRDPD
jgi:hypothetical protein